jgi:hypothetical protein
VLFVCVVERGRGPSDASETFTTEINVGLLMTHKGFAAQFQRFNSSSKLHTNLDGALFGSRL